MSHSVSILTVSFLVIAAAVQVCLPSCTGCGKSTEEVTVQKDTVYPLGFLTDTLVCVDGQVCSGDVLMSLLRRIGLDDAASSGLVALCDSVFDVRKMRAGQSYHAYYNKVSDGTSGTPSYFVYDKSKSESVVFRCHDSLAVWLAEKPVERQSRYVDVTISSSLWTDMKAAGASHLLDLALADVYAWTVDFFGLQQGDRFRVFYSQSVCEGEVLSIDTVHYALFSHEGKDYPAIMLDCGDGGNIYWNEKGESLRKAFLKAPLNYSRISSGFSYARRHPITRRVQPHTAVDYAAPAGTPVVSIGDGTVVSAGHQGAAGNMVKIKHNSAYTTAYLHLSKYGKGIRSGAKVKQGQIIGYVGSTGRSTGPHLDFRVWKNGTPVNPLKMESPRTDPIGPAYLPVLDSLDRHYRELMENGIGRPEYL